MKSLLVFNNMNDLVFWKWDHLFVKHVLYLARGQGLISPSKENKNESEYSGELNPDIVIQIFSPIITSQRIMSYQFGNSYSSVQCRDGTNVVFSEYVGYLLVHISKESIIWMQRSIGIYTSVIKYFCGPDVSLLKQERQKSGVTLAINSWDRLSLKDQAALLGATECITASTEPMASSLAALRAAVNALPPPNSPTTAAIFVRNKLLSLYSTRGADDLTPADIIFLGTMSAGAQDKWSRKPPKTPSDNSSSASDDDNDEYPYDSEDLGQTLSWTVLIGSGTPHALHLHRLSKHVTLILAISLGSNVAAGIATALYALAAISSPLIQRDTQSLKSALTPLENAMKKALDGLKKSKSHPESPQRKLQSQWDIVKRRFSDFVREGTGSWAALEAAVSSISVGLRTSLHLACRGFAPPDIPIRPVALQAHNKLTPLYQFLRVKAISNFTLGSSPAMSKYVEEFPGLIHFMHIDRASHRLTAPAWQHCKEELPRKKIWAMVERTRMNLQEGYFTSMWKDESLHYAHLIWFEDTSGVPIKPRTLILQTIRSLPSPFTLPEDYYAKLTEACFSSNVKNIRCWELLAIHIGLIPAGTALAHARRLAATVCDIDAPPHPGNLL